MLALRKIINLIGGWTYKTKHHLDKDSDIINSNKYSSKRSTGTSSNRSASSDSSNSSASNRHSASLKPGYYKKARGTKNNKSKRGRGRGNKTKSKR